MTTKSNKSLSARGWVPNYHGGWAMISVPVILGIVHAGFHLAHLLLLLLWWTGYFCFYAATMWLRSGRISSLFPPVRAYSIALIVPAIGLLFCAPYLIWWLVLVIPLFCIVIWETMHRRERSFLNDSATIVVACLMFPIAYELGVTGACLEIFGSSGLLGTGYLANLRCGLFDDSQWYVTCVLTLLVFGYFIGTVFYVKTNIRERRSNNYFIASVIFHVIFTVFAFMAAANDIVSSVHAYIWILLTVRSFVVPLYGRKRHWLSVKKIGIGEMVCTLLVFFTLI